MAFSPPSMDDGHAGGVLAFNVRDVTTALSPCPAKFQAKVAYWKDTLAHDVRVRELSLEDILKKQQRAQQQREEVFQGLTARISNKRISADERPRLAKKPKQDAAQLAERLELAETARHSRLEHVSRASGERVARAKAVAASGREAASKLAESRLRLSQTKLAAAAARRSSALRNISAAHAHRAPDAFLRANAARLESLRHSGSLRRIQSTWRHFAATKATTTSRVQSFVKTSVPGTIQPDLKFKRAPTDTLRIPEDAPGHSPEDNAPPTPTHRTVAGMAAPAPRISSSSSPRSPTIGMFGSGAGMQWQRDFDDLSATMQSPKTITAAKSLLHRLEHLARVLHHGSNPDCSMLLRRLYPRAAASGKHIERYPARIFLCAYMLMWQPDMLLTGTSEWDDRLKSTASDLVLAFENLIVLYLPKTIDFAAPESPSCDAETKAPAKAPLVAVEGAAAAPRTVRGALKLFDEAWVDFLEIFVTWKGEDAASIEKDLIAVAVDMQASMLAAIGIDETGLAIDPADLNVQTAAIVAQVEHDQALLRSRVERLSGPNAVLRFDEAVAAAIPSTRPRSVPRSPSSTESRASNRSASTASFPHRRSSGSPAPDTTGRRASAPGLSPMRHRARAQAEFPDPAGDNTAPPVPFPDQNEIILHKLLINPAFRLPLDSVSRRWKAVMDATGARVPMESLDMSRADPAALRAHITATAQDALADAALQQLSSAPPDATPASLATARAASFGQMTDIVSELAAEAFASLPENHPTLSQREEFSRASLSATFATATSLQACVAAVAGLLDRTVQLLLEIGAPGREAKAREAVSRVTGLLHTALGSAAPDSAEQHVAVAAILARALRLLMAQMRVLNSDAANGRLTLLSAMLTPAETIRILRGKLAARAGIAAPTLTPPATSADSPAPDSGPTQDSATTVENLVEKLPISARFGVSSPSAEHIASKLAALRNSYGENPTATLPASIQAGQRRSSAAADAPPPPGSLLASPILLMASSSDTWRARFRAAVVALLGTPYDFAGNPQGPEVLHAYGDSIDQSKGLFQKAVVIGVCMKVASETVVAQGQAPLTQAESTTLQQRLYSIEAAGPEALLAATATVVADAISSRAAAGSSPPEDSPDIAALEYATRSALDSELSAGSTSLQTTAAELVHVIQALLVFGRCEGFENLPEPYVAKPTPPKWANALLDRPQAPAALHGMVGEVAHSVGRICAVAEATYGDLLETIFVPQ